MGAALVEALAVGNPLGSRSLGVVVVDPWPYTASLLAERLSQLDGCAVAVRGRVPDGPEEDPSVGAALLVLNHHAQDPVPREALSAFRGRQGGVHVIAVASPGPGRRAVEDLCREGLVDAIFEKPLDLEGLARHVAARVVEAGQRRDRASELSTLLRFVPAGALRRIYGDPAPGQAERLELSVLFTDLRDSSRWIAQASPQDYFERLAVILGAQARRVRIYEGTVVKTTGDGLLAVFAGVARASMGLLCAKAIQRDSRISGVPVGLGLADGLVLTGLLGTPEHLHFDVIGLPVHVASRLCGLARAGEIVATQEVADPTRAWGSEPVIERIAVRGFDTPVACARFSDTAVPKGKEHP